MFQILSNGQLPALLNLKLQPKFYEFEIQPHPPRFRATLSFWELYKTPKQMQAKGFDLQH